VNCDVSLQSVHYQIETVIKKGGGSRPHETLATLCFKEGATFYLALWQER